jgi:hypothetical protein
VSVLSKTESRQHGSQQLAARIEPMIVALDHARWVRCPWHWRTAHTWICANIAISYDVDRSKRYHLHEPPPHSVKPFQHAQHAPAVVPLLHAAFIHHHCETPCAYIHLKTDLECWRRLNGPVSSATRCSVQFSPTTELQKLARPL